MINNIKTQKTTENREANIKIFSVLILITILVIPYFGFLAGGEDASTEIILLLEPKDYYDLTGRVIAKFVDGIHVINYYDENDNIIMQQIPGSTLEFGYYPNGKIASEKLYTYDYVFPEILYIYDINNRLSEISALNGLFKRRVEYWETGKVKSVTNLNTGERIESDETVLNSLGNGITIKKIRSINWVYEDGEKQTELASASTLREGLIGDPTIFTKSSRTENFLREDNFALSQDEEVGLRDYQTCSSYYGAELKRCRAKYEQTDSLGASYEGGILATQYEFSPEVPAIDYGSDISAQIFPETYDSSGNYLAYGYGAGANGFVDTIILPGGEESEIMFSEIYYDNMGRKIWENRIKHNINEQEETTSNSGTVFGVGKIILNLINFISIKKITSFITGRTTIDSEESNQVDNIMKSIYPIPGVDFSVPIEDFDLSKAELGVVDNTRSKCGNFVIDPGEHCDGGSQQAGGKNGLPNSACTSDCEIRKTCEDLDFGSAAAEYNELVVLEDGSIERTKQIKEAIDRGLENIEYESLISGGFPPDFTCQDETLLVGLKCKPKVEIWKGISIMPFGARTCEKSLPISGEIITNNLQDDIISAESLIKEQLQTIHSEYICQEGCQRTIDILTLQDREEPSLENVRLKYILYCVSYPQDSPTSEEEVINVATVQTMWAKSCIRDVEI